MSIATTHPVKIFINWGSAKGVRGIESALHAAMIRTFQKATDRTTDLMKVIVPESIKRVPPYPPSAQKKSEALMETAIDILEQSMTELTRGGFKRIYKLKLGFPASYAARVNLMRNVRWSKKGSKAGFSGKSKKLLIQTLRQELKKELSAEPKLKPYIGKRQYG